MIKAKIVFLLLTVLTGLSVSSYSLVYPNNPSILTGNTEPGVPGRLTVETIREPQHTKINDSLPEYSWIVPHEAVTQKSWQILVSSGRELIDKNIGDIWNSSEVWGNQSIDIEHQGKPLQPNTSYFWKVRIWDQDNRPSDYSSVQMFKTGNFKGAISSANNFQIERIVPVEFRKTTATSYFIDFGKDAFGTIELDYHTDGTDTLVVRLGEKLSKGEIDRDPGGSIRYSEIKLLVHPAQRNYVLQLEPDERNTNEMAVQLPDSFGVITPFRYCEIENAKQRINGEDIWQKAFFYYFDDLQSEFTCSDTILNQVWDLCKYSMKATSFCGFYIDGDRERIPYEADAYLNQLSHYSVDNEYSLARRTIEYFMEYPTWPTEWQLHVALMFYQDYLYTGNTELIEEYYEPLKHKTLMALEYEDGLISTFSPNHNGELMGKLGFPDTSKRLRDIVDWPPAQKDTGWKLATEEGERDGFVFTPVNTVINSLYYQNMKIMAGFARLLGKPQEEKDFSGKAENVKKSINNMLFNNEGGFYVDGIGTDHGSVHANMMVLAFDIVPENRRKDVVTYIKTRGMACSVYGAQYLLEGLYEAGESEYALDLMRATHDRSWWNMIKVGSTITLEAWDMKYKPNADWNHAWGAAPANIIPRYLWGITPKTPGFGIIQIKPRLGDLENSSIKIPTLRGPIMGSYKRVNDRLQKFDIELPANVVGELMIKFSVDEEIRVNDKKASPEPQPIRLDPGMNHIEIVNSSIY